MYDNTELQTYRKKINMLAKFGAEKVPLVKIEAIPKHFENFQNTNDTWAKIDLPKGYNASGCIYRFNQGSLGFPFHEHDVSERMIVMEGTFQVVIENEGKMKSFILNKNEDIFIKEHIPHKVNVLGYCEILIIWYPAFSKGWEGNFKK